MKVFVLSTLMAVSAASAVIACSSTDKPATPQADAGDLGVDATAQDATVPPDGGATDPDAGPALPSAAYDLDMATAICEKLESCCNPADYAGFFQDYAFDPFDLSTKAPDGTVTLKPPPKGAACAPELARQFGLLHAKWATSLRSGSMKFVASEATRCVAAVRAAKCGLDIAKSVKDSSCFSRARSKVFVRSLPLGATCEAIQDGTYNIGDCDPTRGFCDEKGVCKAWSVDKEPCDAFPGRPRFLCRDGFECNQPSLRVAGKCEPFIVKKVGESCKSVGDTIVGCEDKTFCDDTTSICVPADKPVGAKCSGDYQCAANYPYACSPVDRTCGYVFCKGN
jgi:hypothetical protein